MAEILPIRRKTSNESILQTRQTYGGVMVECSPRMRETVARSPVRTDSSR